MITHDPDEQTLSIRSKLALPDFFKDCCDFIVIEEVSSARLMQISRIFSYAHWMLDTIPENLEPRRLRKLVCIYYTPYTIFCNEIQKYSFLCLLSHDTELPLSSISHNFWNTLSVFMSLVSSDCCTSSP